MSEDKKIETHNVSAPATKSDSSSKFAEINTGKDGFPSISVSSAVNATSKIDATGQPLTSEQGVSYPPTSCYDYYYPGYNGNFSQSDDKSALNTPGSSYADNASLLYYVPSYGPYSTGYMGVDGKQAYPSSEYLQQSCSYGSEAFPCYTYDLAYAGNGSSSNKSGFVKSTGTSGSGKTDGNDFAKTNSNLLNKTSALPYNSKNQQPNSLRPVYQNQPLQSLSKLGPGYHSSGFMRGNQHAGNFSSFTSSNHHSFSQYGQANYQSNVRLWNNNYNRSRPRENFGRNGEMNAANELTRGPRAENRNSSKSPAEVEQLGFAIERDKYNVSDFETVYDSAKFYVIKSYSEDDIHKCIKYDVWSSTPNGNKKLDAAFREADSKTSEAGKKCPVFLFFSVNASGQFVGVAEMIGQVDFSKNMDFWQLDKWNGFFPLKWHIIKDVPNVQLRHIILENNENRPVTYSRDTQEIEPKQGLEMLDIFKNYTAKTCVLDDFKFYEDREKALKAKRGGGVAVSHTSSFRNGDYEVNFEAGESAKNKAANPSSLVALTQNLSLDSQPLQSSI